MERRMVGVLVVAACAAAGLAACADDSPSPAERSREAAAIVSAMARTVHYDVTGTANGVDVTVATPTGTSQGSGKAVPLRGPSGPGLTYKFGPGEFLYVSAQNNGETGNVVCSITVDGKVISQNTASGAYAIATCKGRS